MQDIFQTKHLVKKKTEQKSRQFVISLHHSPENIKSTEGSLKKEQHMCHLFSGSNIEINTETYNPKNIESN